MAFAASAVVLFGGAAIATDAGVWYAARRGAQNAADAAASGAAMVLALSSADAARTAARDISSRNGYPDAGTSTVTVNIPPTSGASMTNNSAVEVIVRQTQQITASGLFLSSAPMVQGRSVASLRDAANVCVLALTGTLQFGGNAAINAPTCVFASNRRALAGVETNGNSFSVRAFSISTVGSCPNCTDSKFQLTQRPSEWQAPVANPFAHLDTKAIPNFTSGTCLTIENQFRANQNVTWQPYETNGGRARCGRTLQLTGNDVLTLLPGTHYIWEQSIRLQGGTLRCPTCTNGAGVTIVLTGSPANIGSIDINGGAATSGLRAPLNPTDADYKGVLLWRDGRATSGGNGGNPPVVVNGGANLNLMGGLYFPNAHSRFNGTAGTALCGVVVGGSFEFTGNAGVAQCNEVGTTVPRTRIVVVAE